MKFITSHAAVSTLTAGSTSSVNATDIIEITIADTMIIGIITMIMIAIDIATIAIATNITTIAIVIRTTTTIAIAINTIITIAIVINTTIAIATIIMIAMITSIIITTIIMTVARMIKMNPNGHKANQSSLSFYTWTKKTYPTLAQQYSVTAQPCRLQYTSQQQISKKT